MDGINLKKLIQGNASQNDKSTIINAYIYSVVSENSPENTVIVTQTVQIFAYYPFLLVSGCLAGLFTGLCAQLIMPRIKFFRK